MQRRLCTRLSLPCLLAATAVLLCSCGGSGKGLIPIANAGPLRQDFEAVARAAKQGEGNCAVTQQAIDKTERDFETLPQGVDEGLRSHLSEGIENLAARALLLCEQPGVSKTETQTSSTEEITETTTTETEEAVETQDTETLSSSSYTPPEEEQEEEGYEATGGEQAPPEGAQGVGPTGEGPPGHYENGGVP
ncbi:MAG TPA: hypothetical protein VGF95_02645 [Solirubrobacteraceae bacterium]|jgi:hypothetical protein